MPRSFPKVRRLNTLCHSLATLRKLRGPSGAGPYPLGPQATLGRRRTIDDHDAGASPGPLSGELPQWNDEMYASHPTPYSGLAGRISDARVKAILTLARVSDEDRVLEVGCERGNLLARMPPAASCVGSDISRAALADAQRLLGDRAGATSFVQLDAQRDLPFRQDAFDVIVCSETLEHVPDPVAILRSIKGAASRRTRIVVSVPIEGPKVALKRGLQRLGLLRLVAPGIEAGQSEWHLHSFSRRLLLEVAGEAGLSVEKLRNVWGFHWVVALRLAHDEGPG